METEVSPTFYEALEGIIRFSRNTQRGFNLIQTIPGTKTGSIQQFDLIRMDINNHTGSVRLVFMFYADDGMLKARSGLDVDSNHLGDIVKAVLLAEIPITNEGAYLELREYCA